MATASERFVKKARAEYDGYLLIDGEYIKESFRIVFENMRDMSNEIDALTATVNNLSARLQVAETKIATNEIDISTLTTDSHTH